MGMCQSCDRNHTIGHKNNKNNDTAPKNTITDGAITNQQINQQPAKLNFRRIETIKPREIMEYKASLIDGYVIHHLKHQLGLTKYTSIKRIKIRQIAEHIILQLQLGIITGTLDVDLKIANYYQTFIVAWIQRTFLDIWKIAHQDLFVKQIQAKAVRRKVTQQYMFELYQLKEFVEAGLTKVCFLSKNTRFSLEDIMQFSDDALLNIFKKLKDKYPQTAQTDTTDLPNIPSWPAEGIKIDLFKHFQCASFSDPNRLNYQTIYQDISFLLNTAIKLQQDFKTDMRELLGADATACVKVALVEKDGEKQFKACAVRRIFVKWTQNLLQNCPQLYHSRGFLNFLNAKSKIINNFYFKSTIQPTTHKIVIQILTDLLQAAKYDIKDQKRRDLFIFNIYDLLRCKIKKNSVEEVVALFYKLKTTKISKTGKKVEVVRIKNRFQTENLDFLVNFRYGDIIIAEAQLCLDDSHVSKQAKGNHQLCHFIYQLERSVFGPSLELMMQYQDGNRPDISVKFEAHGLVKKRSSLLMNNLQKTSRLCFNGHPMVTLVGNLFTEIKSNQRIEDVQNTAIMIICSFCGNYSHTNLPYDYCYKCSIQLCHECIDEYNQPKIYSLQLSVQNPFKFIQIQTQYDLQQYCLKYKALVVLFWLQGSAPSDLMKDCITLQYARSMCLSIYQKPVIALANVRVQTVKKICKSEQIKEYPTLVLYDQNKKAIRKLIGFQWFQVPMLYKTQKQILQGGSMAVQLVCSVDVCGKSIKIVEKSNVPGSACCRICYDLNSPKDIPKQYLNQGGLCEVGHYRCIGCCYAALPVPTSNKDFFGSYLSSSFQPNFTVCPSRHPLSHVRHNILDSRLYTCFSCNIKKFFDDQNGIGYCQECQVAQCPQCFGYKPQKLNKNYDLSGIALHFVQSTAQQSYRCGCGELFKKSYTGCITDDQEYIKICKQGAKERWTCCFCNYSGQDGELHLACYGCRGLSSAMNQKRQYGTPQKLYNLQICIPCAVKSQILQRQSKRKPKQQKTTYRCPKSQDELISTIDSLGDIIFDCDSCNHTYFANTERFYCTGCKSSFCQFNKQCKTKLLKRSMPKVEHRCPQNDPLKFKLYDDGTVTLCDGCMHVIKEFGFACAEDNYCLCQNCIDTTNPTFVGTILKEIKENSQAERNRLSEGKIQFGIAKELNLIEMYLELNKQSADQI